MNVASKELCQELYELSGWDSYKLQAWSESEVITPGFIPLRKLDYPAYDLGYLLRKLPVGWVGKTKQGKFYATYKAKAGSYEVSSIKKSADTPEDAAAMLAIELKKAGIL